MSSTSTPSPSGSSPLARGLHAPLLVHAQPPGIIPARAGFTRGAAGKSLRRPDHPRSRGVYTTQSRKSTALRGSSPLARGLLDRRGHDEALRRIIPARAGFTASALGVPGRHADHPRSRGVYAARGRSAANLRGSSPLARGLRAGFARLVRGAVDHPRSRGVYHPRRRRPRRRPGSSPLARGLLALRTGDYRDLRIIPARAGFTRRVTGTPSGSSDHPRSRGVYHHREENARVSLGSSPLARGLRYHARVRVCGPGIIPARAGFTGTVSSRDGTRWDHPRSRGVYPKREQRSTRVRGSSPLARGLPTSSTCPRGLPRIIPARAGFTPPPTRTCRRSADHPRSRGVYVTNDYLDEAVKGSSPLARGLLYHTHNPRRGRGIIPARAGFTRRTVTRVTHTWDHPRSRGVYTHWVAGPHPARGSSPLARGLLSAGRARLREERIIPARAGFTPPTPTRARRRRDHPRSRGVYGGASKCPQPAWGSSPLARGLRLPGGPVLGQGRIIPARAGFTPLRVVHDLPPGDHPRSRGVYPRATRTCRVSAGSSPLARGLPAGQRCQPGGGRIIPARAGFTPRRVPGPGGQRDHPRSRGVYRGCFQRRVRPRGSSPLARGLRAAGEAVAADHGIIPARAGFTSGYVYLDSHAADHPRSRGVYPSPPPSPPTRGGSSPLARGLPASALHRARGPGIIPARAGFTCPGSSRRRVSCGSSPLARGLPR